MNATSLPFTRKRRRILLTALPNRFVALGLLALALAACGNPPASSATLAIAPSATAESSPTSTQEPTPTLVPTEIPDPEVTFEQLALMDASIGSFTQDEDGDLIYNSPLYNTEVGKNIPVVQQYREVGLDGGREVWIAPEKYPNAPIVIQDLDTGEIRQGPFRYDNDVRRRLTMPSSGRLYNDTVGKGLEGTQLPINYLRTYEHQNGDSSYLLSLIPTSGLVEVDGNLVLPVKSYIGDESDMLSFRFNYAFGPVGENAYWNPVYDFYRDGRTFGETFDFILKRVNEVSGYFSNGAQISVLGFNDMSSRESIPQNTYSSNFYYAYENSIKSYFVLSVLENEGILEIGEGTTPQDPTLFGGIYVVLK